MDSKLNNVIIKNNDKKENLHVSRKHSFYSNDRGIKAVMDYERILSIDFMAEWS